MQEMETLLGLIIGIGLSAACGFRVFVPLLGLSIAALSGHITLNQGFEWIGTRVALIAFATATFLEIVAYYVPWVDNLMDALMTPAAIVAGTIMTASMIGDMTPFLKWSLAIIAGGCVSGIIQAGTVALRAGSTSTTSGLANPFLSTIEIFCSIFITALAMIFPVLCLFAVIWVCYKMLTKITRSPYIKKLFTWKSM
ncbi:MAG: DUF4126 domain-containing protein [Syntrophorhabdaceae bacterium]|nr:DUF4126 domain-containing protein [Syntrophorhabdaceae bacterium]